MPLCAGVLNKESDREVRARAGAARGAEGTGRAAQGPPGPSPESRYALRGAFRHPLLAGRHWEGSGCRRKWGETGGLFTVGKSKINIETKSVSQKTNLCFSHTHT